jgi:TorA maturation chaperone TorD
MQKEKEFHNVLKGYNMLLYFAGTMIMFDPSNECIYDFWTEGILKKLPVKSNNPLFHQASSLLRQSAEDKDIYSRMKEDYRRLFDEKGLLLASPHKSAYVGLSDFGDINDKVEDFYKSYGWKSRFHGMIKEDHIGIELLFLSIMIDKLLEFDDDVCNKEMKKEIRRFIRNHMSNWIPEWNRRVQENSFSASYKGISSLVLSCTEDISDLLA